MHLKIPPEKSPECQFHFSFWIDRSAYIPQGRLDLPKCGHGSFRGKRCCKLPNLTYYLANRLPHGNGSCGQPSMSIWQLRGTIRAKSTNVLCVKRMVRYTGVWDRIFQDHLRRCRGCIKIAYAQLTTNSPFDVIR